MTETENSEESALPLTYNMEGRIFRIPAETSVEQDNFLFEHVVAAGLDDIPDLSKTDDVSLAQMVKRVVIKARSSGHLYMVLAGVLVEEGKEWDEKDAIANEYFFRKIKDHASKKVLADNTFGILLHFFITGANSHELFRKYFEYRARELGVELPKEGLVESVKNLTLETSQK